MKFLTLLFISSFSYAQDNFPTIHDYWLQAAPPNASVMAAYGELRNDSDKNIVLVDAYSPAFAMTMIHQSILVDGVAKMTHQDEIIIKPGEKLTFKPGSYHIMLMQADFSISKGDKIKINLIYLQDGNRIVQETWFPVEYK